ncbi:hypothetical protein CDAR_4041 [Caerostris darwini]|uniref:Uncharacterized protein n=1 Tax=Caerostris darwini TaxID=1538125 RepID=A0AAV4U6Q9_9ARAC|nr:hypothetical protein CDAR_4041 [Caerostris darwini]
MDPAAVLTEADVCRKITAATQLLTERRKLHDLATQAITKQQILMDAGLVTAKTIKTSAATIKKAAEAVSDAENQTISQWITYSERWRNIAPNLKAIFHPNRMFALRRGTVLLRTILKYPVPGAAAEAMITESPMTTVPLFNSEADHRLNITTAQTQLKDKEIELMHQIIKLKQNIFYRRRFY